jgi:phage baseplate assembly protein W
MSYKVTPSSSIVLNEKDRTKAILQNVAIILRTWQQSVPLYLEFGMPMRFQDAPMNAAIPTLIIEVREAIQTYEPRATLLSVNFSQDSKGILTPEVEVDINEPEA